MKSPKNFIGNKIYTFAKDIFYINRSITGEGVRHTIKKIKKILPSLKVYEIPSGKRILDWVVPLEWNIKSAHIKQQGKSILDLKDNNLHIVGYSQKIDKIITLDELKKKIHYLKKLPEAIPYVVSYYNKTWGFCMNFKMFKKLKKGKYKISINSSFKKGSMTLADLRIKGKSNKEILLTTYTCHPSMGNNETSGICLLSYLGEYLVNLNKKKKLNYSYRIVFHPETIGAIAYINKNLKDLKKNVIAGYVVTCVGDDKKYSYLKSKQENSLSNRAALNIFKYNYKKYDVYNFTDSGSDERRYNAPGVNLPLGSVMRSKYGEYKEYHTSLDNLKFISKKGFQNSFDLYEKIITLLENNLYYKSKVIGEPNLGKRNLYPLISKWPDPVKYKEIKNLINFLSYADGNHDLIEIADILKISGLKLLDIVEKLKKGNLISSKAV
jgi:aminopeptidase-like protein